MENEVVNYIKEAQKHGLSDLEIKQSLLDAGWEAAAVEESFTFVKAGENKPAFNKDEDIRFNGIGEKPASAAPQKPVSGQTNAYSPQLSVTEQHFAQSGKPVFFKRPAFWILLLVIAGLVGGGYYAYAYLYNNPTKVWKKFLQGSKGTIFENTYKFEYSDHGSTEDGTGTPESFSLKDIKLGVSGDFYVKNTDPNNPESKSALQYTFTTGNTSVSTGFQYLLVNKNLYLEIDNNPFLDSIVNAAVNDGKKYKWIKLDMNAFQEAMNGDKETSDLINELLNPSLKTDMAKIWDDATLVKIDKYLGKEQVNGVSSYHFKNSIDKQAVKDVFSKYINRVYEAIKDKDKTVTQENIDNINITIAALVDKIEVKEFETWIGTKDYKLHRVHFVSNAPSFISLVKSMGNGNNILNPLGNAQSSSRDTKRLADVRQLASALELYFNDNNGYPPAVNGSPAVLSPTYIGIIPQTPTPADGACSNWYNTYWYEPKGSKTVVKGKELYSSYELTFCLGSATGGYQAGIAKLTPQGIQGGQPCLGTAGQCTPGSQASTDMSKSDQIKEFINKLDYNAEIRTDVDYTNYGKEQQLQVPTEYFDLMKIMTDAQSKSRDAKRMADVRQLASALELYFYDKNTYPSALSNLTPNYIGVIPDAPTPPDGTCSADDNKYTFKFINNNNYQLDFCLGASTGGYTQGKHSLSPAGIK
jgi:hypothetical protein